MVGGIMIRIMRALCLVAVLGALPITGQTQWPPYPSSDVPRNEDGSVNMDAPPPRTDDGKIDFSGIWEGTRGGGRGRGPGTGDADAPPSASFFNVGSGLPGGTAPMTEWAQGVRAERMEREMQDNPDAHCLPMGHMQFHTHPQPRKMIQTDELMIIIYEGNWGIRQVLMDGRSSPDNDPLPWWYGYSIGEWDGDELVVTTTHMRDDGWLDVQGTPFTSEGTIVERFRRPTFGRLEIDVTIEDPNAFTEPFTVRVNQSVMVDTNLIEFICQENEQSSQYYD